MQHLSWLGILLQVNGYATRNAKTTGTEREGRQGNHTLKIPNGEARARTNDSAARDGHRGMCRGLVVAAWVRVGRGRPLGVRSGR